MRVRYQDRQHVGGAVAQRLKDAELVSWKANSPDLRSERHAVGWAPVHAGDALGWAPVHAGNAMGWAPVHAGNRAGDVTMETSSDSRWR